MLQLRDHSCKLHADIHTHMSVVEVVTVIDRYYLGTYRGQKVKDMDRLYCQLYKYTTHSMLSCMIRFNSSTPVMARLIWTFGKYSQLYITHSSIGSEKGFHLIVIKCRDTLVLKLTYRLQTRELCVFS